MATMLSRSKGRNVSTTELDTVLNDAGRAAAAEVMRGCLAQAGNNANQRTACMISTAAKQAWARASGRNVADITNADLRLAAGASAVSEVKDTAEACVNAAANSTARTNCFKGAAQDSLREKIANNEN